MDSLNKWAERVYTETDFARSIAITLVGILGLCVYLSMSDWTIALFATIIVFPTIRIVLSGCHQRANRHLQRRQEHEEADYVFNQLSDTEKSVARAFVKEGGSVLTFSQINELSLHNAAIESLRQREFLSTSFTADGARETFVLDSVLFDAAQRHYQKI